MLLRVFIADELDRPELIELVGPVVRNTDDNMRIEYSAPRSVHTNTSFRNVRLIEDHAVLPLQTTGPDPFALLDLASTYERLEDPRAEAAEALAHRLLDQGTAP